MTVSSGPPTPFVGRDDELAALADAVRPDADGTTLIRVSGEAGVGKSRLVAEAARRSDRRALTGYSSPGSLGRPFDLLLSAVEPDVRNWCEIPGALSAVRSALTELLRGVAPALDADELPETPAPGDVISAGIALLRHLDPELLVLEDLHWADVESLQVTERLLAAPEHPVVIVTYRSEELDGRDTAAELLGTMSGRRASLHLHLSPFDQDDITRLVTEQTGTVPSTVIVERLRARTGGNAFFLEEILASTDGWDEPADRLDAFPETLTETLRLRLKGLSADERDTLATAAVLGSPFDFDLLATALEVNEAELIERLRTLIDRRLIIEPEVDVFRFRHELVRESMLASLLGREKRRLHDRAWTATMEHCPTAYAELARHAGGSGRFEDLARLAPKGVRHYLDRGSTRQAFLLAELGLEHRPDDVVLRQFAARAAWLTGQSDVARRHALHLVDSAGASSDGDRIDALALLGRIAYERDQYAEEAEIVAEMEELLADINTPTDRARLLADLAQHHMLLGEFDRSVQYADDARVLADEHGLDDLLVRIAVERASAEASVRPSSEDALATLQRAAKDSEAAGDHVTAARALHNLSLWQPPDEADATLDAMSTVAERGGFDLATAVMLPVRKAHVAVTRADLHAAQAWIDRARPFVHRLKSGKHIRFHELLIRLETGADIDPEAIDDLPDHASWSWSIRVRHAAQRHDTDAVSRLLGDPPRNDAWTLLAFAAALSDLADARTDAKQIASTRDTIIASDTEQLGAELCLALLAERIGEPDAGDQLDQLTDVTASLVNDPKASYAALLVAEMWLARARLAARAGHREEAREHAGRAAARLSRWPGRRRDEALTLAADDVCSEELTGREIDVARLVARGMTNGQIAEELFIARKTVSSHVSHILTKLDMASRTEIATWAVRSGLAADHT